MKKVVLEKAFSRKDEFLAAGVSDSASENSMSEVSASEAVTTSENNIISYCRFRNIYKHKVLSVSLVQSDFN